MRVASGKKYTVLDVLRSQNGFSLSELLVTLILVGLISAAVAGGVSMVARSYTKVVDRADAEQLLSTVVNRITDELSFARDYSTVSMSIKTTNGNKQLDFVSGLTGMRVRITAGSSSDDSLHMYYYYKDNPSAADLTEVPLIDDKLKARMTIDFKTIEYDRDNCQFTITGLGVKLKGKSSSIATIDGENYEYVVARING